MAPKPRNPENKKLPKGWRWKHGAIYYRVPPEVRHLWDGKQDFRLGRTIAAAHWSFGERKEDHDFHGSTMGDLFDRYTFEVVPEKAPKSQESNLLALGRLRIVFSAEASHKIKPSDARRYIDLTAKKHGDTSANRDFESPTALHELCG